LIKSSGFAASVQEDVRTGEVTIAFGSQASALATTGFARLAQLDIQHDAAVNLAVLVQHDWSMDLSLLPGTRMAENWQPLLRSKSGLPTWSSSIRHVDHLSRLEIST